MTPEEFWSILHSMPEPVPVFYRLYYNDDGTPICYTMEDLPGKYIDIDQLTYARSQPNVRVVDGKIIEIIPTVQIKKLKPGTSGTACDPRDICVVVDQSQPHINWSVKTNEAS